MAEMTTVMWRSAVCWIENVVNLYLHKSKSYTVHKMWNYFSEKFDESKCYNSNLLVTVPHITASIT